MGHRPTFYLPTRTNVVSMQDVASIESLVGPSLESMGYAVVRVRLFDGKQRRLQIMAERADGAAMTVDDCAVLSRTISALLDVEDPIPGPYLLEVSSPGLDRPLVRREDFARFAGYEARIETARPLDGRRRFRGALRGVEGENVLIEVGGEAMAIAIDDIAAAKLVITDALIEASLKRQKA